MPRAGAGLGGGKPSGSGHHLERTGGSHHIDSHRPQPTKPSVSTHHHHHSPSLGDMVEHEVKRNMARNIAKSITPPPPPPPKPHHHHHSHHSHVDVWVHPHGGWRRPVPFGLRMAEMSYDQAYFDKLIYALEKIVHHDKIHRDEGELLDRTFGRKIYPHEAADLLDWVRYERGYLV